MAKIICIGHFDSKIGIAHEWYHVVYKQGVSRNHIFGIADPTLPIHNITFTELR